MGAVKKIVILHGWSESTEKWSPLIDLLKENKFAVALPLIPGLTAPLLEEWTLENYVEWVRGILEKEAKVILVGHSNGGRIALAFTHKYPEKVENLVLIDTAGIRDNHLFKRVKRNVFKFIAKVGKKVAPAEILRTYLFRIARERDYLKANPTLRKTMANLLKVDLTPILGDINTKTLIIWGRLDKITPLEDAYLLKREIKNSELFIIDEARHSPQFTHPTEVAQKIAEAIKG